MTGPKGWFYAGTTIEPIGEESNACTLSIKNVPDDLADRLRSRAEKNHRSLQGELMAMLHETLGDDHLLTPAQFLSEVTKLPLATASESTKWIRRNRDAR